MVGRGQSAFMLQPLAPDLLTGHGVGEHAPNDAQVRASDDPPQDIPTE
jgi:hypothetical protein